MAHQLRALIALLLTLGLAVVLLPAVALAVPPADSCMGFEACEGNTGGLQPGACIGFHACLDNSGNINENACHSSLEASFTPGACQQNTGSVGVGACLGGAACFFNAG